MLFLRERVDKVLGGNVRGIFGTYLQKIRKTTRHLNQELEYNSITIIMREW